MASSGISIHPGTHESLNPSCGLKPPDWGPSWTSPFRRKCKPGILEWIVGVNHPILLWRSPCSDGASFFFVIWCSYLNTAAASPILSIPFDERPRLTLGSKVLQGVALAMKGSCRKLWCETMVYSKIIGLYGMKLALQPGQPGRYRDCRVPGIRGGGRSAKMSCTKLGCFLASLECSTLGRPEFGTMREILTSSKTNWLPWHGIRTRVLLGCSFDIYSSHLPGLYIDMRRYEYCRK